MRQDKVKQSPKFGKVVLQRSTGENEAEASVVVLSQDGRQLAMRILHAMTLINDHIEPFNLGQETAVLDNVLIGGEHDIEFSVFDLLLNILALSRCSFVFNLNHRRCPFFKFKAPIGHCGQGDDDKERSVLPLLLHQMSDQRNRLNRLSQTHFIS